MGTLLGRRSLSAVPVKFSCQLYSVVPTGRAIANKGIGFQGKKKDVFRLTLSFPTCGHQPMVD